MILLNLNANLKCSRNYQKSCGRLKNDYIFLRRDNYIYFSVIATTYTHTLRVRDKMHGGRFYLISLLPFNIGVIVPQRTKERNVLRVDSIIFVNNVQKK